MTPFQKQILDSMILPDMDIRSSKMIICFSKCFKKIVAFQTVMPLKNSSFGRTIFCTTPQSGFHLLNNNTILPGHGCYYPESLQHDFHKIRLSKRSRSRYHHGKMMIINKISVLRKFVPFFQTTVLLLLKIFKIFL